MLSLLLGLSSEKDILWGESRNYVKKDEKDHS